MNQNGDRVSSQPSVDPCLFLQRALAGLVVLVAIADWFRWHSAPAAWPDFGPLTPMGPGTDALIVLLGSALALPLLFPSSLRAFRLALGLGAVLAAACLHVLGSRLLGAPTGWEGWLGASDRIVNGFSAGWISSQSAACALLSLVGFAGLFGTFRVRWWLPHAGIFAALLVEVFAFVATMSYAAGNPPVTDDGWLQVPPLAMLAFALVNLVLLLTPTARRRLRTWYFGADAHADEMEPFSSAEKRVSVFLGLVGVLALSVSVIFLRIQTGVHQRRCLEELRRAADLKIGLIERWRFERFGDANAFMRMPGLGGSIQALAGGQAAQARRIRFTEWLRSYVRQYGYRRIVVFDASLQSMASQPAEGAISTPGLGERLKELRPDSTIVEFPPYVDGAGKLHWDLLVPLPASEFFKLEGAVLIQADLNGFITPILQAWPREYATGQSVLSHQDGNTLLALGGYRAAPGIAPHELRPFGTTRDLTKFPPDSLPARAFRNEIEAGEGPDYRGVMIVGVARALPNTTWWYTSRVDSSEVYAPLRRSAVAVAGAIAALLATTGAITRGLWQHRQKNALRARLTAELEQKRLAAQLGAVMRQAKDAILLTSDNLEVIDANQQAVGAYGWTKDELLRMKITGLCAPKTSAALAEIGASARSPEGAIFEEVHRRRDGSSFPVEVSARRVESDGKPQVLFIVRDISERKQFEQQQADANAQLHVLAGHLQNVREKESRRIARAVHDELGQLLTAINLQLGRVERAVAKTGAEHSGAVLERLTDVNALVDQAVVTVQRIAAELRPVVLDHLGLFAALQQESADFENRAGMTCRFIAPDVEPKLSPDLATNCYRIVQEALTNVARHAGATLTEIEFRTEGEHYLIEVRDNGRGIAPDAIKDMHAHGLLGMQERARSHHGDVVIVARAEGGTLVRARLPVADVYATLT